MDREEFARLFRSTVIGAVREGAIDQTAIADRFVIEFHGAGPRAVMLSVEEAVDKLYLGPERMYRIIDVGLRGIDQGEARLFVRPSGHEPATWDDTWDPSGNGPFKIVGRMADS